MSPSVCAQQKIVRNGKRQGQKQILRFAQDDSFLGWGEGLVRDGGKKA